jgi:hypothetical protein
MKRLLCSIFGHRYKTERAPGQELLLIGDWVEFARQLERENNQLLEALRQAEEYISENPPGNSYGLLDREVDKWQRQPTLAVCRAAINIHSE